MRDSQIIGKVPPVWMFSMITGIRNFFRKVYYSLVPAKMAVFEKSQGFWLARSIGVACELNLAEIIGNGKKAVKEIADLSNTDPDALYRFMRALASEGIFKELPGKHFKNTPQSFALQEQPGNLKNMIMHQLNPTNWEVVNELKYSVETGDNAAQKMFGTDIFTHLKNTPERNALYNKAMSETSGFSSAAVVSAYCFRNFKQLADIGGGEGMLLGAILRKHKHPQGILFDLPHVVENAYKKLKEYGIDERIEIIEGDFFKDDLPKADAYIMKNILHAFDDATCIQLLKKISKTMVGSGKILIVETIIKADNRPAFGKVFDLQMLLGTEKGKERTEDEFRFIFKESGFKLREVIPTVSPFCIVEGTKF